MIVSNHHFFFKSFDQYVVCNHGFYPRGVLTTFLYREVPPRLEVQQPLTLLYTIFQTKMYPFLITVLKFNYIPFINRSN